MKVTIVIPSMLRYECDGQSELLADVESVLGALPWLSRSVSLLTIGKRSA
ncbi:hypothetical protein MFFC18_50100 [Mariniblastus fucicola]|uniref:Uncharacterized protein n=1 Tax=Mariniblastus fucicola TaxID=980251 RepID=A0A5B9PEF3_9BACT|nr:hypothetical protein MFFC18_50100 [Mariniblastus fucicola]